ncbi:Eco57I restriction-modification methylase domain-containing protein [Mariniphaga sp.]|uniref:Eco57I restriction-modification methylase domain-containing protein n=1 Tax=Mariniphaga sp. TaxID=1954475 RepID=UPI003567047D
MIDFSLPYSKPDFNSFLEGFLPEDYSNQEEEINIPFQSKYFEQATYLGESKKLNLSVYEVRHTSEHDARVGLTREMFRLMAAFGKRRSLVVLVPQSGNTYRFSLVTIDLKLDENDNPIREYSNPKRYSFILGEDAKLHTPQRFLISQGRVTDFDDLLQRFSVEVVNKEFYNQIAVMFSRLVGGKRKQGSRTQDFEHVLELPSTPYDGQEQKYKEFAVRLIGRTVFCWFLKKKKSANNIPLIPEDVLSTFAISFNPNYYHSRVEPLFFNVLNTPVNERTGEFKEKPYDKIPFLNGGLFEPQPDDFYAQNRPNYALKIPDEWWKDFIEILETYNFTIDENTSIDIDLSVDPEMLGRIFENLLAEINPETGETARKSTGSYYTPRPIVEYMVDESLKRHLSLKTKIDFEKLDTLLDFSKEESGLTKEEENQIFEAIKDIKVIDPAVGSGAFPMGVLQKMLLILQKVDHDAKNSIEQVLNDIKDPVYRKIVSAKLKEAEILDNTSLNDYARKLNLIRRSIYGIDNQPVATEIARLRFFLSIIVDEVVIDEKENRNIDPLPNLEFKFVCANSLISIPKNDYVDTMSKDSLKELETNISDYFNESSRNQKAVIRKKIIANINDIIHWNQRAISQYLEQIRKERNSASNSRIKKLESEREKFITLLNRWASFKNIFRGELVDFFETKYFFPDVKNKFDIVIGNPPYGIKFSLKDVDYYKKVLEGEIESYLFFYFRGLSLLSDKGVLCFITPDSWLTNRGASLFRDWLVSNYQINDVFDCYKPFSGAKDTRVHTVSISHKNSNENITIKQVFPSDPSIIYRKYRVPFKIIEGFRQKEWKLYLTNKERDLFSKMEKISEPLEDLYNLKYGLRTGNNSKYITTQETKYPVIAGSDIAALYEINWTPKYLTTNEGLPQSYFKEYFVFEKIIVQYVRTNSLNLSARWIEAAFVRGNYIPLNSLTYFYKKTDSFKLYFLLALLNSNLLNKYYRAYYTDVNVKPTYLSVLPIVPADSQSQSFFIEKVTSIHDKLHLKEDTQIIQRQIDLMVYKLYELTYDEALIVDPELPGIISREDYEKAGIEELAEWEVYKLK